MLVLLQTRKFNGKRKKKENLHILESWFYNAVRKKQLLIHPLQIIEVMFKQTICFEKANKKQSVLVENKVTEFK